MCSVKQCQVTCDVFAAVHSHAMRPEDELGLLSYLPHSAGVIIARADCTLLSQDVNCKHLQTTRQPWQTNATACEMRSSKASSIRLADVSLQQLYSSESGMRCSKPFLPQHAPADQACPYSAYFCQSEMLLNQSNEHHPKCTVHGATSRGCRPRFDDQTGCQHTPCCPNSKS